MRLTDFWQRLETRSVPAYAAVLGARPRRSTGLGGRTVDEAIADGVETVLIWRAVHAELALHPRER